MPPSPSRRTLLLAAVTTPLALSATPSHAADAYDTLRLTWRDLVLGTGFTPTAEPYATKLAALGATARDLRSTMAPASGSLWPDLPYADPEPDTDAESYTYSGNLNTSYNRLRTMAEAYAQPGTGLTGDTTLRAEILTGLDHLHDQAYNASQARYGNWYNWQIGIPQALLDIDVLLYDHLGAARIAEHCAAVDHFVPNSAVANYTGTSTGANRVDLCRSVALRGVLGRSPAKLALARDALSPVFPYVTKGDGLYADGSFVQHTWVAYSGTYGQVMLDGLGRLFALLAGSPWDVTDPNRQIVLDSVEHAYAPLLYNGLMMDSVNGRAISRGILRNDPHGIMRGDHFHGQGIIAAIALLAGGASAAERDRWHARVKGWIERDTVSPVLTAGQFGVADLARLHAVAASPVPAAPEPVGHKLFAAMDRAVHRRPGWAANISMASERIAYYECGNGENPRGWHTGAGMLYWWGPGGDAQYTDWFWPTVDPYRLPGTTVSTKRLPDRAGGEWGEPKPAVQWVGGVTDGEFAAVGQHLKGLGSTLEARKSWFCAADTVICLGAGISCADGVAVETIVDNRNLGEAGDARLTTGPGSRWAHLEGHGGWVLRGGAPVKALREDRTGAWRDINTTSTTERRTRRYQTLWLDHGTDPADASYAYLLMPGASRRTVAARAYDPHWLEIVDNTAARQAVAVPSLGLTAANFWQPGTVGPLTTSAPASLLVRRKGRTVTVCVSEPPRTGRPLEITWHHPARHVVSHDPSVEVLGTGRTLRLRVAPGTAGGGHRCTVVI